MVNVVLTSRRFNRDVIMLFHSRILTAGALAGAALLSTPATAQRIGDGNLTVANVYIPTVNLATSPSTYTATFGNTVQVLGTGSFSAATGGTGTQNGTLLFSNVVGTTINQQVTNFFTFQDGLGGFFNFTPTSVTTRTFNVTPGVSSSVSLFLLGDTVNTVRTFTPTPTSLTLSFNNTGGSAFSSSATLSIPPADMMGAVPEPATWAMMITGFGMVGGALRRARRTRRATVRFAA